MQPNLPKLGFSPPPAYITLLRKAVEAGFVPTEAQQKWLDTASQGSDDNDEDVK